MKKNLFMVAAVALAMVSCNKEELVSPTTPQVGEVSTIVFTAEACETKTSLGTTTNGITAVNWCNGDKIKVNGVEFTTTDEGATATFKTTEDFNEAATYYAAYPSGVASGANLTAVTISASQSGTFAAASISVAMSNNTSLQFKNVAAMLKFQVPAAASKVTIESTSNLAGTFPVTFNEAGEPVIGTVENGSKTITLTDSFETGTDYYVAVLPGSHKFTIRLDGYLSKASTKTVSLVRAQLGNLGALPAPVASEWGIVGGFNSWANDVKMYKTSTDNLFVAYGVEIKEVSGQTNGFKIRKNGGWGDDSGNYGTLTTVNGSTKKVDTAIGVYTDGGSGNITVAYGTYDIYFDRLNSRVYVMTPGKVIAEATQQTTTTKYSFAGSVSGWDDSTPMVYAGDGIWTINRTFKANEEWKVKNFGNWNASWGYSNVYPDQSLVSNSGGNAKTIAAGDYIVGFVASINKITFVKK